MRRRIEFARVNRVVAGIEFPDAVCRRPGHATRSHGVAWTRVAEPGEDCVLWDLDRRVGVGQPWGVAPERVAQVMDTLTELRRS